MKYSRIMLLLHSPEELTAERFDLQNLSLLRHGNWHGTLFWLTVKLSDCDTTVRKYERRCWYLARAHRWLLTLEQYSPLRALLKSQNCWHKMLVRPKVLLCYLERLWILYVKIWCLPHIVHVGTLCQLIIRHLRTSQAFTTLRLSVQLLSFQLVGALSWGSFHVTVFS